MELRQLRYFASVAKELNFTRAAAQLRVAQPALSRQIRQLEEEIGGELLVRDRRRVSLTERGAAFLRQARAILEQADQAVAHARAGVRESLSIGYVWGMFHSIAPLALQRFRTECPGISTHLFDMSAREQSLALAAGKLDIGFIGVSYEAELASLDRQAIGTCEFNVIVPKKHRLAKRKAIELESLQDELFLLISDERFPGASHLIRSACESSGFKPKVLQMADRGHTVLGLVAAGCGVAVLPETLKALPHEGVVFRRAARPIVCDLCVSWRRGLDRALIERFVQCIPK